MPAIGTMVKIESSPHVKVKMFDKNENTWDVVLPEAGDEAYYPRWTNDPDFLTHTGHGRYSKAFLCRFASDYKSIEKSVLFASGGSIYHPGARIGISSCAEDWETIGYMAAHAIIGDIPVAKTSKGYIRTDALLLERATTR